MRLAVCTVAALALAGSAAAALPERATLIPGRSLAGIRIGDPAATVRAAFGLKYGICTGCKTTTWYFTYRPFGRQGLAVELTRGRVSGLYTVWKPSGWTTPKGLQLGAVDAQVTTLAGPSLVVTCTGYEAYTHDVDGVQTVYYVLDGKLWGFGLLRSKTSPCR
jgi:hypothetical protein